MTTTYKSSRPIAITALFTAITAVFSQIAIPQPFSVVQINLGLLAVLLAGGILPPRLAVMSQGIFLLLGGVGIPVFAGFKGGFNALVGPTGGYLVGYIVAALLVSVLLKLWGRKVYMVAVAMTLGVLSCYTLGTIWYSVSTNTDVLSALLMCVLPFIIGDALKIAVAVILTKRVGMTKYTYN